MFGVEIAALTGLFGLTGAFALIGTILAAWMAWRIVEKAGLPGWAGLGAILVTLTGIGTIVPLILLWVFAFMRWPRDELAASTGGGFGNSSRPAPATGPVALGGPSMALPDARGWRLAGALANGGTVSLGIDGTSGSYTLTGAPAGASASRMPAFWSPAAGWAWKTWAAPAVPSSTAPGCCPSTARATSAPCAPSASAASNSS